MADVEFEDYTVKVKGDIESGIVGVLHEVAGELVAQTKRNCEVNEDSGKTKNSFDYHVDENSHTAFIGSSYENAIWEEFGTGEYALKGNGRPGYWVFVKGSGDGHKTSNGGKIYDLEGAKQAVAFLRSQGLEAYYTKGKRARRPFFNAYTAMKSKIIKRIQSKLGGG